jgi:hypothetical protein
LKPVAVWARPFDDRILLPGGREIVTLRDAGDYITSLPKAEPQQLVRQIAACSGDFPVQMPIIELIHSIA